MLHVMHPTSSQTPEEYLGPTEAAQYVGVSTRTLVRYEERGLLTARRLPTGPRRYARSELDALIRRKPEDEPETAATA